LGAEVAVLMNTDAPYGVDYVGKKLPALYRGGAKTKWAEIENDNLDPKKLREMLDKVFTLAPLSAKPAIYAWHPSGELNEVFRAAMVARGWLVHRQIIWAKPRFVLSPLGMYHWSHESCFYGWIQGKIPPWYGPKDQQSVWEVGKDDGKSVHPTQKPVELFEIPMRNHTAPGGVCYEPFSGSGSQIIAGERLGRRVYAIDISPQYVDVAIARWEAFTGGKATKAA
jgi:DNA modification methylase